MGRILIADAGAVSNPSTTITAVTAGSGSTFTVRGTNPTSTQSLVGLCRGGATAGLVRVRSPYLSDNVQGIRFACPAADQDNNFQGPPYQSLVAQDALTVEVTGGSAEYDGALLMTYYDDLVGASPKLHMPGDIIGSAEYVTTWEVDTTASATEGDWANTAITHLYDESKANRWYAILGYVCDTAVLGVAINGADTSNFNIGGPGLVVPIKTSYFFADLSMKIGQPCVPCINSANKGNTNVATVDVAASTTSNVNLIVAIMPASWQA